ncbi:Histone-lysine N-methyltransferase SETMAR [Anthophora retusa]
MSNEKVYFRTIVLFYFRKGKNAVQTAKKVTDVHEEGAVNERMVQRWFKKFQDVDFSLNDEKRSGRPINIDKDQISSLIESNPHYTTREIAEMLRISKSSVENHLH